MKRMLVLAMWLVFGLSLAQGLSQLLPPASELIIGKLPNGLSYYIRQNSEPKNRAELRLVVNAGSLMEDDDQKGLAHFLEHMLFNGTRRFPGLEIDNFLEKNGMRNGADLNAYTSFGETVYMLRVPTEDQAVLQKALDVLEDWAGAATLDPKDIQEEVGVVVEEERSRYKTGSGRVSVARFAQLYRDSRYGLRLPIGDMNIIRKADTAAVRRFYETWYRPDLMAVVAVGDFDPRQVEAIIQKNFASLGNPASPKPRPDYTIPKRSGDSFLVIEDPELQTSQVWLYSLRESGPERTLGDVRGRYLAELFDTLFNHRLDEVASSANAPFVQAGAGSQDFTRSQKVDIMLANVREGKEKEGLEALITELRQAKLGFTASELQRAKQEVLASAEKAYNERDKRSSESLAEYLVDTHLSGGIPTNAQTDYDLARRFVGEITLEDVNAYAKQFASSARDIIAQRPKKEGLAALSDADLKAALAQAEAKPVQAYQDTAVQTALLEKIPAPASVAKENKQKEYTELVLANGARVLYKKTDFKADEVLFRAYSPGGASLYPDEDYPEATTIDDVVNASGLGAFDRSGLQKVLSGKQANVVPYIAERDEGMTGNSTLKDLETLFQLANLYFTAPRADPEIFNKDKETRLEAAKNRSLNPISAVQDALDDYRGLGVRGRAFTPALAESLNRERGLEIYKERFGDASDFTFMFVGNFDEAKLREYAQTYLGSLPGKNTKESWKNVFPKPSYARTEKNLYKAKDDRSLAILFFAAPLEYSPKNSVAAAGLRNLLDIRFNEELREKLGGVYSTGTSVTLAREPNPELSSLVQFSCDPKKAEDLLKAALGVLEEVKAKGVSEENMAKVREQLKRTREEALRTNAFWMSSLQAFAQYPDRDPNDTSSYFDLVAGLKSQDLQQMAQLLFTDKYLKSALYPETMQPK